MVNVNPRPQIQLPKALADMGIEVINFFEEQGRFDLQMRERSGGDADLIDDAEQAITSTGSRVSRNAARINAIEKIGFEIEMITSDFTTSRNQIIICNNSSSIEVTLDADALVEDTVHIKRANAELDVIGVIDGLADRTINVPLFSLHLVFNGTDWSQI